MTGSTLQPDARGMLHIRLNLKHRLRTSLDHLLLDLAPEGRLSAPYKAAMDRWASEESFPHCTVFAAHKVIMDAALNEDREAYNQACDRFLALEPSHDKPADARIQSFSTLTLGEAGEACLGRVFSDDVGMTAALRAPDPDLFETRRALFVDALNALAHYAPDWKAEFDLLVSDVFLAQSADPNSRGFGGASVFDAFGSILINPEGQDTLATAIMTLIHESSHSRLFLHHLDDPVLLNDEAAVYKSPLRTALRPMEGIFHAAWVSARMAVGAHAILQSGFSGSDAADLAEQAQAAARVFRDCMIPIKEHAEFSPLGLSLCEDAVEAVSRV